MNATSLYQVGGNSRGEREKKGRGGGGEETRLTSKRKKKNWKKGRASSETRSTSFGSNWPRNASISKCQKGRGVLRKTNRVEKRSGGRPQRGVGYPRVFTKKKR